MKRHILTILILLGSAIVSAGQSAIVKEFRPACDSLAILIQERNSVKGTPRLQAVMKRGSTLDFYFTESLGDYPWHREDIKWFRTTLKALFPEKYHNYALGEIYSKRIAYEKLVTPHLGFSGFPTESTHSIDNPLRKAIVQELGGQEFSKGLEGRHIALWHSHGYYYDQNSERWQFQRPYLFQTVEDMFTQSFVLPFLIPMLENAGAYVLLPRERDIQHNEVIADNDQTDEAYGIAAYSEKGKWKDAGTGFAALKPVYEGLENPFTTGTARQTECIANGKKNKAVATWCPEIPERGEYAVYVSYKSTAKSTSSAHYTVRHLGGTSEFAVNQKMGGGTWVYLGTFEFAKGSDGCVELSNETPEGYRHEGGSVVSADAVRFGGGMGNIARKPKDSEHPAEVSGMPRYAEGARYSLQWSGMSPDIYSQNEEKHDYRDDFMSRGDWVEWISRGSSMNSSKNGMGIPVDLALGFHSDAGITPNDSIVGTLAIYTLRSDGSQKLPTGDSRMTSREYSDMVQSQIVHDIRAQYDTLWSRRHIWDRSYRESRTPSSPAMLLELLSHQNFADMKYGLDPTFRFTVSRAVYKGMLKYLSNRYDVPYIVQPLPVESMGVAFGQGGKAVISWTPVMDEIEPTASPEGYIMYTRIDNGGFDNGVVLENVHKSGARIYAEVPVEKGHIYSFRIAAYNEGGRSFPSETVSIGLPSKTTSDRKVLIVNNFDRVSGPAFVDTPVYAGFDNSLDSGVPYIRDIAYVGDMFEFRRDAEYQSNDNAGFGACHADYAGQTVAGNTFDFPYTHGKAFMKEGYAFYSCSNETFCNDSTFRNSAWTVDMICGKQVTTIVGSGLQQKYSVFPQKMQDALKAFTSRGGNVLISGSKIATDVWDSVYPVRADSLFRESSKRFVTGTLGYRWASANGSRKAQVRFVRNDKIDADLSERLHVCNEINPVQYSVEALDGLSPASRNGAVVMRYADSGIPAGICHDGKGYRTMCLGFPIEALTETEDIEKIIRLTLEYFNK